jgi:hypothetical protein
VDVVDLFWFCWQLFKNGGSGGISKVFGFSPSFFLKQKDRDGTVCAENERKKEK